MVKFFGKAAISCAAVWLTFVPNCWAGASLSVSFSSLGFAQEQVPYQERTAQYLLQPEDLLRIQVYNQPQLQAEVPVGQDGYVTVPFLEPVLAEGRTIAEVILDLQQGYQKKVRLKEPLVSITILRYRELRATISGFVNRPGTFPVRRGDTILGLLSQGGGPVADRADLRRATLQRANTRELIPLDLYAMLYRNDTSQNFEVRDGDQLNVPEGQNLFVKVQGKVLQPGLFPYKEPMTLADALSQARGEVVGRSRLSKILIIPEKTGSPGQYLYIQADYVRFIRKGDVTQNVILQPGDLVWVPETNTPDFAYISALANVAFIVDRLGGGLFGVNIFGN